MGFVMLAVSLSVFSCRGNKDPRFWRGQQASRVVAVPKKFQFPACEPDGLTGDGQDRKHAVAIHGVIETDARADNHLYEMGRPLRR